MTTPPPDASATPHPDEVNRLWQHGLHEERLFYDRLNYFSAIQVGLLGVFAILYHKEPSVGVFVPLTAAALAFALLWLRVQVRHWRYCVHVYEQLRRAVPVPRRIREGLFRVLTPDVRGLMGRIRSRADGDKRTAISGSGRWLVRARKVEWRADRGEGRTSGAGNSCTDSRPRSGQDSVEGTWGRRFWRRRTIRGRSMGKWGKSLRRLRKKCEIRPPKIT